ncbi:hypothetical protein ScPMuIL_017590 [Solemya velum]
MAPSVILSIMLCVIVFHSDLTDSESPSIISPSNPVDDDPQSVHQTDSLTILMLLGLLLLTILTVWLFKHRRFRFVHETGLSMVYGLIVGAIIRYTNTSSGAVTRAVIVNNTHNADVPPEYVFISLPTKTANISQTFKYNFIQRVDKPEEETLLEKTATFDPELFFNVMLPLIIFEAGYSMKRRHFFRNFGAITAFAFLGTAISCVVVGGILYGLTRFMSFTFSLNDCFLFGAIISATDPVTVLAIFHDLNVDVDLYAMVFGESVLNDAVAIVLSGSIIKYGKMSSEEGFSANAFFMSLGNFVGIFAGSFAIGSLIGCNLLFKVSLTLYLMKFTKLRDFPLLESALFVLMSYSSFQAAEGAGLTGIVAVLFCGITQAHYTFNNLSPESKQRTKQLFELTNFLAENFVFLYIGVSIFTFEAQEWHAGFIFASFLGIIVGRFFNIYPLSLLLNLGRKNKIKASFMHMMMFSGLRGAIAYALAIRDPSSESRQLMVSATMTIVLATVIICGGLTTPMLQWLEIRVGVDDDVELKTLSNEAVSMTLTYSLHLIFLDARDIPTKSNAEPEQTDEQGKVKKAWLVGHWHNFDVRFMKPFLTNSRPTLMETVPQCCMPVAQFFTTEEQMSRGDTKIDEDSDTDMIIDHSELSIGDSHLGLSNHSMDTQSEGDSKVPKHFQLK